MPPPNSLINAKLLLGIFPFHFTFDSSLIVHQVGASIEHTLGMKEGDLVTDYLELKTPNGPFSFSAIKEKIKALFLFKNKKNNLIFRGQIISLDNNSTLTFLGSPLITTHEDLKNFNLKPSHFPIHDNLLDFLVLIQSHKISLKEAKSASEKLLKSNQELRVAKKTIEGYSRRFEAMLDHVVDGIFAIDQRGEIQFFNQSAQRMFGYQPHEVIGKNVNILLPKSYHTQHNKHIKNYIQTKDPKHLGFAIELVGLRKDGSTFPMELANGQIEWEGERLFAGLVRDITNRKKQERELDRITKFNKQILDTAGEGIYGLDLEGNTTFCNPAAARMIGYEIKELIGKPQHAILHHSRPDGSPYPRNECPIYAAFKDGMTHHVIDEVFWRKDGSSFPVDYTSTPIIEGGKPTGAVVTFKDTTERNKMEKRLHSALSAAVLANESKTKFLANTSHEIRTPLNTIIGFSKVLKDFLEKRYFGGKFKKYLQIIIESGESLTEVINSVLDLSKIESGKVDVSNSSFDLSVMVKSIYHVYSNETHNKNLHFRYHLDKRLKPFIYSDRVKLSQILTNFIGNAFKFTQKGEINFHIERDRDSILFKVQDTGIGISKNDIKSIFFPFEQAYNSTTKEYGGSGLGLAIARDLAILLNGKLWCESQEGKGSCFYLRIPDVKNKTAPVTQDVSPNIKFPKSYNILLVEDNENNLLLSRELLDPLGVTIYVAKNGKEAIEMTARLKPDIILMDIQMPIMGGIEATKRIRQNPEVCKIPIIGLSAYALNEHHKEALDAGLNDYLSKPLDFEKLVRLLHKHLDKSVREI